MRRGSFEMQVNVVSRDTLLAAREHPEPYRDLLVRVAGYSDYFTRLSPKMQEEVIARTGHEMLAHARFHALKIPIDSFVFHGMLAS